MLGARARLSGSREESSTPGFLSGRHLWRLKGRQGSESLLATAATYLVISDVRLSLCTLFMKQKNCCIKRLNLGSKEVFLHPCFRDVQALIFCWSQSRSFLILSFWGSQSRSFFGSPFLWEPEPELVLVCPLAGDGARAFLVLDFWGSQTWSFLWLHHLGGARAEIYFYEL